MSAIETNAATVEKVVRQLAAWGWTAELYSGWRTRHNRQATLVWESVTVHHTGAGPVSTSYMVNPTDRASLVVLCNAHVTKDHRIRIIAAGGASHAGMNDRANYSRMRAGSAPLEGSMKPGADSSTFSANRLSFGIEVDNNRGTPEWDDWMRGATVALCAALHVASGWKVTNAPRVITHKELTRRKPGDPILDAGKLRSLVKAFLAAPYGPPGSKPVTLGDRILGKDNGNDVGADVAALAALLKSHGYDVGAPATEFGPAMDRAVRAFQTKRGLAVDGLVGPATLAALKIPDEEVPPVFEQPPVVEPPDAPQDPEPEPPFEQPPVVEPPDAPQDPEPEPPKPKTATFWFGWANLQAQRWGGLNDSSASRGTFLRTKLRCSVYGLCEVNELARDATRKTLGRSWLVHPQGYVTNLWDGDKWSYDGRSSVSFGTNYHGAVRSNLKHRATGIEVDVIAVHVRPRAAFSSDAAATKGKQADIAKALKLVRKGVPTIMAGDFNTSKTELLAADLVRATPKAADTLDKAGVQSLDQVWTSPDVQVREAVLVNPGAVSDHRTWRLNLAVTES